MFYVLKLNKHMKNYKLPEITNVQFVCTRLAQLYLLVEYKVCST